MRSADTQAAQVCICIVHLGGDLAAVVVDGLELGVAAVRTGIRVDVQVALTRQHLEVHAALPLVIQYGVLVHRQLAEADAGTRTARVLIVERVQGAAVERHVHMGIVARLVVEAEVGTLLHNDVVE